MRVRGNHTYINSSLIISQSSTYLSLPLLLVFIAILQTTASGLQTGRVVQGYWKLTIKGNKNKTLKWDSNQWHNIPLPKLSNGIIQIKKCLLQATQFLWLWSWSWSSQFVCCIRPSSCGCGRGRARARRAWSCQN